VFSTLKSYCDRTATRWEVMFVTLSKYYHLFGRIQRDTFHKLDAFHVKAICYILAAVEPDPGYDLADVVVFLYLAHVVEDDYELDTSMTGAGAMVVLAVNEIVFPVIMRMDRAGVDAFWAGVFPTDKG